jgi:low temperature requirement protein LtrA
LADSSKVGTYIRNIFVERHGLIVIIALGETLIVAAAGLVGATRTPAVIATGVLAVAVTCGLWWSYF